VPFYLSRPDPVRYCIAGVPGCCLLLVTALSWLAIGNTISDMVTANETAFAFAAGTAFGSAAGCAILSATGERR